MENVNMNLRKKHAIGSYTWVNHEQEEVYCPWCTFPKIHQIINECYITPPEGIANFAFSLCVITVRSWMVIFIYSSLWETKTTCITNCSTITDVQWDCVQYHHWWRYFQVPSWVLIQRSNWKRGKFQVPMMIGSSVTYSIKLDLNIVWCVLM